MAANFKSNKNNLWKINSNNLLLNGQKVVLKKKISPQIEEKSVNGENIVCYEISPSDDVYYENIINSIYIKYGGKLRLVLSDNSIKEYNLKNGSLITAPIKAVLFTDTTASGIIVLT